MVNSSILNPCGNGARGFHPLKFRLKRPGAIADILWDAPEEEVLIVESVQDYDLGDDFGEIMGLIPCSQCRELVSKAYLRVVGDAHMCIPCSGYDR